MIEPVILSHRRRIPAFFPGWLLALLALLAPSAFASGPRWVTGPPYFTGAAPGNPVLWGIANISYFTDPADLSPSVSHAAADAIVAAAAGIWNVPTASITLAQGGTLAEHVSSANAYLTSSGPVFPSDIQPSNYATIPIAVLYDSDGSVTDMLLGSGASLPAECRQNAVTEDVDGITTSGTIQHAILILNGRCTGPAPEQQLQLQYQLERAFGRVLGIAWSQTNDNVFTRSPQPTAFQAQHWPIMHPIDIVCGPYTYQCLPSPFTLRDDDVAAISGLYPYFAWEPFPTPTPAPGKQWSYVQAGKISGHVTFPTGQGMAGVNVVLHRWRGGTGAPEPYEDVSAISGDFFRWNNGNPVAGSLSSITASMGSNDPTLEGFYQLAWVPDEDPLGSQNGEMLATVTTQPINPLYIGAYSLGPYAAGIVSPSGPSQTVASRDPIWPASFRGPSVEDFPPADAASSCSTSADGTESAPASIDPSGWWTGVLCAYGHTAWSGFSMQPGRTATIEVTALDESSLATTQKAMPLLGVSSASDPTGELPTVAATPAAFNTLAVGTTATRIATNSSAQSLRFVIADARGDGRPDFAYRARVLYADTVAPAAVSPTGGPITITGTGFRSGNSVTINGVTAQVLSWTSTSITAIAPPQSAFTTQPSGPVTIAVADLSTGGSATMSSALTYSASIAPDIMTLIAAPAATLPTGTQTAFAIRITLPDGVTPIAALPVAFTWTGPAQVSGCSASPCTIATDSTGLASISIDTTAFGAVNLTASALGLTQSAAFTAVTRNVSALQPTIYIAANSIVTWIPQLSVFQNSAPAANLAVDWTDSTTLGNAPGFSISPASTAANSQGIASTTATLGPLAAGSQSTAQACAWNAGANPNLPALCATFTAIAVQPSTLRIAIVSGANQTVTAPTIFAPVILRVTDAAGHPVAGATVNLYQTVDALEPPCPTHGPCPIPPVLASSTASATSDTNGLVSVTPTQVPATGAVTNLAAATGTQGFVALSLTQLP
ncbi:MAG TPA: IPT/TIG domain-containing protein [Acidobacteriaceae bacterium]|nr:IPT/TIG domain-containing protein [Acidobacteriaceae bacterium]